MINTDKIKSYLILKNQRHLRSICRKIGISLMLLLTVAWVNAGFNNKIDSLKTVIETAEHDTIHIIALNNLAWEYSSINPDTALLLAEKALAISKIIGYKKMTGTSLHMVAWSHYILGNYTKALEYNHEALEIWKELKKQDPSSIFTLRAMAGTVGNTGIIYMYQGDYPNALKQYHEYLKMAKELDNKQYQATALGNIGIVYYHQGDYLNAMKYYREAFEMNKELGNKSSMADNLGNLGNIYADQGDNPNALKHFFEALEIDKALGNKNGIARHLGNIGITYADQHDFPKALKHLHESLIITKEIGDKSGIAIWLGNIGWVYIKTGRFQEAETFLNSALALSDSIGYLVGTKYCHEQLSHLFDTTSRWQLAYHHYKKYSAAKDSLFNEEKSKEIGRIEQQHEFEMAEIERKKVESEKLKAESEKIKRRDLLQYSTILIGIFLFFGLILLMGKFNVPVWVVEASVFMLFLLVFEFTLVLLDPTIDAWTGGAPAYKLLLNALLAGFIFPVHGLCEGLLKKKIFNTEAQKAQSYTEKDSKEKGKSVMMLIILLAVAGFNTGFENKIDVSAVVLTKVDSLKAALAGTYRRDHVSSLNDDTTRINLLNDLAWELRDLNTDTAILLSTRALEHAEAIARRSEAMGDQSEIHFKVQKLIGISCSYLGVYYDKKGDYQLSLSFHFKALEIRKKINDKQGLSITLANIGNISKVKGDYTNALKYFHDALNYSKSIGDQSYISMILNDIASVHYYQSNYPTSLKYFQEALIIAKELEDKNQIMTFLVNIGSIYNDLNDYTKTMNYYLESLEIAKELGNKRGIALRLSNIGTVYHKQSDYTNALKYYNEALIIFNELGDKKQKALNLGNIGIVYSNQGDSAIAASRQGNDFAITVKYPNAVKYYMKALIIDRELGSKHGMAIRFSNIGALYLKTGKFSEANDYIDSSLALSYKISVLGLQKNNHYILSIINDTLARLARTGKLPVSFLKSGTDSWGYYKLAYEHYQKYSAAKDSLFNEEKSKEIGRIEQKHEFEMAEITRKAKEDEQSRQEAAAVGRRNLLQYSAILIGIFLFFGLILLFVRLHLPTWVVELSVFMLFLLIFEFTLVLLDPTIDAWTGGAPAYKLLLNALLAGLIFPVHGLCEGLLKKRLLKNKL